MLATAVIDNIISTDGCKIKFEGLEIADPAVIALNHEIERALSHAKDFHEMAKAVETRIFCKKTFQLEQRVSSVSRAIRALDPLTMSKSWFMLTSVLAKDNRKGTLSFAVGYGVLICRN